MEIFLTGGTGFVGREILAHLLSAGHRVRALVRREQALQNRERVETVVGDTTEASSLSGLLCGCDAVIHLVGIIREKRKNGITFERLHVESTYNVAMAAKNQGVSRFLQMSANGSRAEAVTAYHQTKWAAEELLRQSQLDWTIFRPSLIFGPNDQFVNMLAGLIRTLPVVPVPGDGKYRLQPVSVTNVAEGFVRALAVTDSIGQTYHCAGPRTYSYNEILDMIGAALGRNRVYKLHQPLVLMKPLVALLQSLAAFPLTSDQLQMLLEGNCCDPTHWRESLNLKLIDFNHGIAGYLR
ncbi:MAG: complex I NDUFA9 subunit family protein [Deltaproteobacteria bacterium]|nr:complex I NDUFA9 subunit family protein [Deltaproteobacteria bacterium]